jgi:hypothetical protein
MERPRPATYGCGVMSVPPSYAFKPPAGSTDTSGSLRAARPRPAPAPPPQPPEPDDEATVAAVADEFLAAARDGRALNRTGRIYRPSALRDIAGILRANLVPELGDLRLVDVQPEDLQRIVDDLVAGDLSLSRIRSVISAFRALFGYAVNRGIITASPADDLEIGRSEEEPWDDEDLEDDDAEIPDDDLPPPATERFTRDRPRPRRAPAAPADGDRGLPEAVLGFVLRLVVVVFIIITLASLAQALLMPA